ncbi:MAG TPA: trypsin-like peptidase domain-containing protein [Clostridia bacterium]|nr:trypsin-like peptidase domain-containing protein [Clostridia bacterium]
MYNDRKIFRKILITSLACSLLVGMIVFFAAPRYISLNEPAGDRQSGNAAQQLQAADGKTASGTDLVKAKQQSFSGGSILGDLGLAVPISQAVAQKATAGVVGITVERITTDGVFNKDRATEVGVGSGVVVSQDGYILTNNHVAGGKSNRITVSFADGRNVDGETVWADPVIDLAVVKVNLTGLKPLTLGDATKLQVGEPAVAIGNPLGLEFQRSVTSGIVSALNRTISIDTDTGTNYMEDLIQTDASINPGNSGGPLLNSKGEVVGINTVKVESAEGMGFAIPINISKPIVAKLVGTGKFAEPYLGVFAYDRVVFPYINGAPDVPNGVYISKVDNNGPAYKGGIREGCVISQIDGITMDTMLQLREYLYSKAPGDTLRITHLKRDTNNWVTATVVLGEKTKDGMVTR